MMPIAAFIALACFGCGTLDSKLEQPSKGSAAALPVIHLHKNQSGIITGQDAFGDWTTQAPGVRRKIVVADLPQPYATLSSNNPPRLVPRPENGWPIAPPGFDVQLYATGLQNPREIVTAPNGDLFVAQSGDGSIRILRGLTADGKPQADQIFATGFHMPFGIAFYPPGPSPKWVYIGNTDSIVRLPYKNGDLRATGPQEIIVPDIPSGGRLTGGGHWTRDVRFTADGKKMYVSVGSVTNDYENPNAPEKRRADILEFDPDGKNEKVYAYGLRNAVGLEVQPKTGTLWASVNERDALGNNLVPDYITRVKEGGFYGWPWFYMGGTQDPRHPGEHPELKDKVLTPDVLLQPHYASLEITFYTGNSFPSEYHLDAFAAEHGSWNRSARTGYEVIRVPLKDGAPDGSYEDFLTGFVAPDGNVWGRPVGVAVAPDGALMVSDDGTNSIWRVQYRKSAKAH
jgi:glucose/arabinose dehydrogenase